MRQQQSGLVATSWIRWWRFNGVGALGVVVQLLVLAVCLTLPGVGREMAVAVAVSSAVLHNFVWHRRWTWRDRSGPTSTARLFIRFAATNGLISLVGNVAITSALVSWTGANVLVANAAAIVVCSAANFILTDRTVFRTRPGSDQPSRWNAGSGV
jgi:putative flippase GtrA